MDSTCAITELVSTALLIGAHLGGGQPPGESAKVPLAADVRARAQQHVEAQLLRNVKEALDVCLAIPLEGSRAPLVEIPGHIQLHSTNMRCCNTKTCLQAPLGT